MTRLLLGLILVCVSFVVEEAHAWPGLGVIGDEHVVGFQTHPEFQYDPAHLWMQFTQARQSPAMTPVRLWPALREYDGNFRTFFDFGMQAIGRSFLDQPELGLAAALGSKIGYGMDQIVVAGQSFAESSDASRQTSRLLERDGGRLPTDILMMFSYRDLCGADFESLTTAEEYVEALELSVKQLVKYGVSDPGESTTVWIVSFLPLLDRLIGDVVEARPVSFYGQSKTCGEAKRAMYLPDAEAKKKTDQAHDHPLYALFTQFVPPNPLLTCPTMHSLGSNTADKDTTSKNESNLANRIRAYREGVVALEGRLNEYIGSTPSLARVRVKTLRSLDNFKYASEHIAQDCFSISPAGYLAMADGLSLEIASKR
jgi:hypothetical protein